MTVRELIEKLVHFPSNMEVVIHDREYEAYWPIGAVQPQTWDDGKKTVYIHPFEPGWTPLTEKDLQHSR